MTETQVLIIGGGPVGLALAVDLGLRGITVTLIEQSARHSPQPRAKTTNVRSMEHMRRWGVAEAIRAAAPLPRAYPTDVVFATRLFGRTLAKFHNAFFGTDGPPDDRFAERAQWTPQYKVEGALRARAASLPGVTLRFGARLESMTQDADGVDACLTMIDTGRSETIRAAYVIGADGARSRAREAIGANMQGSHAFAQHVNLVIRAPALAEAMTREPAIMYWLVNAESAAFTGPMDGADTWFFMFSLGRDAVLPDAPALQARLNAAFGRDVPTEILVVDPWSAHSLIADRYRDRRILLAGDACHLHPPFGGYGMNLGLGDAADLGWKLAAVLRGWGGAELLDSYEAERKPAHRRVIDEAVANHALLATDLARPGLEAEGPAGDAVRAEVGALILAGKAREFHSLGVVLGTHYDGSPIVVPDGTAPMPDHPTDFQASARPGNRAPHLWLADGSSLFDHFGAGFCLLVTAPGPGPDVARLVSAAEATGLPLRVLLPQDARLGALYGARLALIRPDQHVAWRGDTLPMDAGALLDWVRGAAMATMP